MVGSKLALLLASSISIHCVLPAAAHAARDRSADGLTAPVLLGQSSADAADTLFNQTARLYQQGRYAEAIPLAKEALTIRESLLEKHHPDIIKSLNSIGQLYQAQGSYAEAIPFFERSLASYIATVGENHPDVVATLENLAYLHKAQADYSAARVLYERAIAIVEAALGEDHPRLATSLNYLALLHRDRGDYAQALPLFERSLAIRQAALGENHPDVATSYNNLALLYKNKGDYARALPLYEQAIEIYTATLGENHPAVATGLDNLAVLYKVQGDYAKALPLYEQALSIYLNTLGENHPDVGISLNNLAAFYREQGSYSQALELFMRSLTIVETALGENHPTVAATLNNIAELQRVQGNYAEALPLQERSLAIVESTLGENHPAIAASLNNLALLAADMNDYAKARSLFERSLTISEATLGADHPDVATILGTLAELHRAEGDYAKAEDLFTRSLSIRKAALGENHFTIGQSLTNLADVQWAQNSVDQAVALLSQSSAIEEQNLSEILIGASEIRRQQYINTLSGRTSFNIALNLQAAPENPAATELALSTVLRRKGRVLDATANSLQRLREQLTPAQRSQLDELTATRTALANLQSSGLGTRSVEQYQDELNQLTRKAEAIEGQLARASAEFRIETEPVSISAVQKFIPDDGVLVEFVRYHPYNPTSSNDRWDAPRYAVYVLTQQGNPQAVDLGEAASIDQLVQQFQTALSTQSASTTAVARQLDERLIDPIRPFIAAKDHLLISPDSQLNLIPFDALVDKDNNYLIETYQTSYLSSGRNLLDLQLDTPSQAPPVILANPNYESGTATVASTGNSRSVDARSLSFSPLPGTAREADAIAPFLPDATLFTQSQATESNLKQVNAPSILHIATHGFFLPDVPFVPPAEYNSRSGLGASLELVETKPAQATQSNLENPLLRSGLALAGANNRSSGEEDGIFTALEASGLNLRGTKLVVLSACETGVGSIRNGEGVYGLRRTFAIAGAESQLMSLWQVDDTGTSELMQLYYENLIEKGQGRSEALRNAQLALLNTGTYQHPYYWSSFIFSGDWRPVAL